MTDLPSLQHWLIKSISSRLGVPAAQIDVDVPLATYGLGSRDAVELSGELEDLLGQSLSPTIAYEYPTIRALARALTSSDTSHADARHADDNLKTPVEALAVVGLACRFPGADGPDAFWQLLREGVDAISEVPEGRWPPGIALEPDGTPRSGLQFGGFLDGLDRFDAELFTISPREARTMDPQQRLLLELTWEALERAGIAPDGLAGSHTGVFVGQSSHDYADLHMRFASPDEVDAYLGTGNAGAVAAGRISFALGLQGPSLVVDTACSSSLVGVHLACRSLRSGESDLAIAAGVNVILSPEPSVGFSRAHMLSPRGRCRTFDASADGYVRSEGCGVVVLRRLSDALSRGERVLAIIRGSAINQDGRTAGLTAPNGLAQTDVIRAAWRDAGVRAGDISYVEAHGTGTLLGDPIEVRALGVALGDDETRERPCAIGSVKTNLGHLEAAAGMAGLIKTILALDHREIPPNVHLDTLNPHIEWTSLPIHVPREIEPWPSARPRRAGVSSFGFSGTNAHVVVEEAPEGDERVDTPPDRPAHILRVSAQTSEGLTALAGRVAERLDMLSAGDLADFCYSANTGRAELPRRLAAVGATPADLAAAVRAAAAPPESSTPFTGRRRPDRALRTAWLFTGQGAQYVGMGRELYEGDRVFRDALDRCARALDGLLGRPLLSVIYGDAADPAIHQTDIAQPALFSIEYALAQLWQSWGFTPAVVLGHSLGEWTAACVAGAVSLEDALTAVAARGRFMQAQDRRGKMAAIPVAERDLAPLLQPFGDQVVVAAVNAPREAVISGQATAIDAVLRALALGGIQGRELAVSHAFHSPLMEPACEPFGEVLQTLRLHPPALPFVSSVTGAPETTRITEVAYWRDQIRRPVRFADALQALDRHGVDAVLEIGPGSTLINLGRATLPDASKRWLPSIGRQRGDWQVMLESVAQLYAAGADVAWDQLDAAFDRRRVDVPTYVFQRERHWMDAADRAARGTPVTVASAGTGHPLLGRRLHSPALAGFVWESTLEGPACAWLRDHQVAGVLVMPAAAFIDMAATAVRGLAGGPAIVEDLVVLEPLRLGTAPPRVVQVIVSDDDRQSIQIVSRDADENAAPRWQKHVTARWSAAPALSAAVLPDPAAGGWTTREPAAHYDALRERGLEYGPSFQAIDLLQATEREAIGRIALPAGVPAATGSVLHPAMLDACFQVVGAIDHLRRTALDANRTFVPIALESFQCATPAAGPIWAHASLRALPDADGQVLTADVHVFDVDRSLIGRASGLAVKAITLDQVRANAGGDSLEPWTFETRWNETLAPSSESDAAGEWLLVGGRAQLASAVRDELARQGGTPVLASPQATPEVTLRRLRGVVWLAGGEETDVPAASLRSLEHWRQFLVTLGAQSASRAPQITLVTMGVQPIGSGVSETGLAEAALWGFARTVALEHPEWRLRAIDIDDLDETDAPRLVPALVRELISVSDEDVALRADRRYVRRLTAIAKRPTVPATAVTIRPDASYLVTGGTGALGLQCAMWLAESGAGRIVLVSRRPPSDAARAVIASLEAHGTTVIVERADAGDAEALAAAVARVRQTGPPLRGVVHAAGVLRDALLLNMTAADLEDVVRPKIAGAWHLHRLTRDLPLEFFVMFSSVAAVVGSPGQANYAAGNAFLDTLAAHRAAAGLPALSVNWGPWAGAGMASVMRPSDGLALIEPSAGLRTMAAALSSGASNLVVMPLVRSAQLADALAKVPVLRDLAATLAGTTSDAAPARRRARDIRGAWRGATIDERVPLLTTYLREEIGAIVRSPAARIDELAPLAAHGLDSLMGLELRDRIAADLTVTVPMARFVQTPNVRDLVGYLMAELEADEALGTGPSAADAGADGPAEGLLARVDDLSDDEVDALLTRFAGDAGESSPRGMPS